MHRNGQKKLTRRVSRVSRELAFAAVAAVAFNPDDIFTL